MNVNELMNMNDRYYVGNIIDTDGNDWVTKQEAQAILDELGITDTDPDLKDLPTYGDESPAEYKDMQARVGMRV